MDWLWLHIRFSLRLGGRDALKIRDHLVIGLLAAMVALAIAWAVTGQVDALYGLLVWPAMVVPIYMYFVAQRLASRDLLWEHDWRVQADPTKGQLLYTSIRSTIVPLAPGREFSCWFRDSSGQETEAQIAGALGGRGLIYTHTTEVTPGTYVVIWRERKPPTAGRWRVIAYYRALVPEMSAAGQLTAGSIVYRGGSVSRMRRTRAIERIAAELARQASAGREEEYQRWFDYYSGRSKDTSATVPQEESKEGGGPASEKESPPEKHANRAEPEVL